MSQRITVNEMAMRVARAMAERSEDPWTKVGAVALTFDNRIFATAYNGLMPGFNMAKLFRYLNVEGGTNEDETEVEEAELDRLRGLRLPFMCHAEQNLCSLIKRGRGLWCVITVMPCPSCLLLLAAHGIQRVVYDKEYARDKRAEQIAEFYDIQLVKHA